MRISLVLLVVTAMTACSSAQKPVYFYTLGDPSANQVSNPQGPLVLLHRLEVADYLKQSNLVMQTGPHELQFAKSHIWAEDVANSVIREVTANLNRNFNTAEYIPRHDPRQANASYELSITLSQFLPTYSGDVIASGQIWITHLASNATQTRRFNYTQPLTQDGYAHAVMALTGLLSNIATDIDKLMQEVNTTIQ